MRLAVKQIVALNQRNRKGVKYLTNIAEKWYHFARKTDCDCNRRYRSKSPFFYVFASNKTEKRTRKFI